MLLPTGQPAAVEMFRYAPTLRLLANFKGEPCKRYTPEDLCGEDVELAANRLPAYFSRLVGSLEQLVSYSGSVAHLGLSDADLMILVPLHKLCAGFGVKGSHAMAPCTSTAPPLAVATRSIVNVFYGEHGKTVSSLYCSG